MVYNMLYLLAMILQVVSGSGEMEIESGGANVTTITHGIEGMEIGVKNPRKLPKFTPFTIISSIESVEEDKDIPDDLIAMVGRLTTETFSNVVFETFIGMMGLGFKDEPHVLTTKRKDIKLTRRCINGKMIIEPFALIRLRKSGHNFWRVFRVFFEIGYLKHLEVKEIELWEEEIKCIVKFKLTTLKIVITTGLDLIVGKNTLKGILESLDITITTSNITRDEFSSLLRLPSQELSINHVSPFKDTSYSTVVREWCFGLRSNYDPLRIPDFKIDESVSKGIPSQPCTLTNLSIDCRDLSILYTLFCDNKKLLKRLTKLEIEVSDEFSFCKIASVELPFYKVTRSRRVKEGVIRGKVVRVKVGKEEVVKERVFGDRVVKDVGNESYEKALEKLKEEKMEIKEPLDVVLMDDTLRKNLKILTLTVTGWEDEYKFKKNISLISRFEVLEKLTIIEFNGSIKDIIFEENSPITGSLISLTVDFSCTQTSGYEIFTGGLKAISYLKKLEHLTLTRCGYPLTHICDIYLYEGIISDYLLQLSQKGSLNFYWFDAENVDVNILRGFPLTILSLNGGSLNARSSYGRDFLSNLFLSISGKAPPLVERLTTLGLSSFWLGKNDFIAISECERLKNLYLRRCLIKDDLSSLSTEELKFKEKLDELRIEGCGFYTASILTHLFDGKVRKIFFDGICIYQDES